jgi:hypothetical protein
MLLQSVMNTSSCVFYYIFGDLVKVLFKAYEEIHIEMVFVHLMDSMKNLVILCILKACYNVRLNLLIVCLYSNI